MLLFFSSAYRARLIPFDCPGNFSLHTFFFIDRIYFNIQQKYKSKLKLGLKRHYFCSETRADLRRFTVKRNLGLNPLYGVTHQISLTLRNIYQFINEHVTEPCSDFIQFVNKSKLTYFLFYRHFILSKNTCVHIRVNPAKSMLKASYSGSDIFNSI